MAFRSGYDKSRIEASFSGNTEWYKMPSEDGRTERGAFLCGEFWWRQSRVH